MRKLALALFALPGLLLTSPALAGSTATVSVVHGVPGITVDVYVNGDLTLPGFKPGTITESLSLPPGEYHIRITAAGDSPDNAVISGSAVVMARKNYTLVAHLAADGSPTLSAFLNDVSRAGPGKGRVVVRHLAAAPTVDVGLLRGSRDAGTLSDLMPGKEAQVDVRAGQYRAQIFPAGGEDAVFGPAKVTAKPKHSTIVYAIGSLEGGSFQLLVQRIPLRR